MGGSFFFILFITILNLGLWVIFLIRFKNLFTYDEKLDAAEERLMTIIKQTEQVCLRNVEIAKNYNQQLKDTISETERHIAMLHGELENLEKKENFLKPQVLPKSEKMERKPVPRTSARTFDPANRSYESLLDGLFDTDEGIASSRLTSGGEITIRRDGSSYATVPVYETSEILEESPVHEKNRFDEESDIDNDFTHKVRKLSLEGFSEIQIAKKLGCSLNEVELVLD